MPTIRMFTGVLIDPLRPDPNLIDYIDIAHGLSGEGRYSNHTPTTYTVGMHVLVVSEMVPEEFEYDALMHDAGEAYLRDVPTPVKHMKFMAAYRRGEDRLMKVIAKKYGFRHPKPPEVEKWDVAVRRLERFRFMRGSIYRNHDELGIDRWQHERAVKLINDYHSMSREEIKKEWIEKFYNLRALHVFPSSH